LENISCDLLSRSLNGPYNRHYTRPAALAVNLDVKTYDSGQLHLCTVDGTAVSWGKLWVDYDIDFFLPQLNPSGSLPLGGSIKGATTQTAANPFGVAPVLAPNSEAISMNTASVLTFTSIGLFNVDVWYIGTVITAIADPTFGAGVASGGDSGTAVKLFNAAATLGVQTYTVNVTSLTAATMAFSLTATTVTAAYVAVGQMPVGSE